MLIMSCFCPWHFFCYKWLRRVFFLDMESFYSPWIVHTGTYRCTATLATGMRRFIKSLMRSEQRLGRLRPLEASVSPTDVKQVSDIPQRSVLARLARQLSDEYSNISGSNSTVGMYYHYTICAQSRPRYCGWWLLSLHNQYPLWDITYSFTNSSWWIRT